MAGFNTRIHAVGDRRNGIVIVTFDPFRVVTISTETIKAFSDVAEKTPDEIFTMISRAVLSLIGDLSKGDLMGQVDFHEEAFQDIFGRGIRMSDADFALSGLIDVGLHHTERGLSSRRKGYKIIHEVMDLLTAPDSAVRTPQEIALSKDEHS